jgi:4-aminobutyrate aminotransferase-like enzyme
VPSAVGNGFPLGVVITTKAIATSFANGMEYFNTFGGNPVACQVGLAVLKVLDDERLQQNALRVGAYMMERFRALQRSHSCIGDVRGLGLFVGVELVVDRETLEPAGALASEIANDMAKRGVLISTDGPFHNVLKLKPPICITRSDGTHPLLFCFVVSRNDECVSC